MLVKKCRSGFVETASRTCPDGLQIYKIQQGDTIHSIARRYKTSINQLLTINSMKRTRYFSKGDSLFVPIDPSYPESSKGMYYMLQQKETLASIAKYFNLPIEFLLSEQENNRYIDRSICIPIHKPFPNCPNGMIPYRAVGGDSYHSIAMNFGLETENLLKINKVLEDKELKFGELIYIPVQWKTFFDQTYRISFMHPVGWTRCETNLSGLIRYEQEDGYFEISSIAAPINRKNKVIHINVVCSRYTSKRTYGHFPIIKQIIVEGMEGLLINPSEDQHPSYHNLATFILPYPRPVQIGGELHHYLIIHAHKAYIKGIIQTMKYLNINLAHQSLKGVTLQKIVKKIQKEMKPPLMISQK